MNILAILIVAAVVVCLFSMVISPLVLAILYPEEDQPEAMEQASEVLDGMSDTP